MLDPRNADFVSLGVQGMYFIIALAFYVVPDDGAPKTPFIFGGT